LTGTARAASAAAGRTPPPVRDRNPPAVGRWRTVSVRAVRARAFGLDG